jgi:membrane-associated protein
MHYWVLSVIVGALIVALAAWVIRRWRSRHMIEPTAEKIRSDFQ